MERSGPPSRLSRACLIFIKLLCITIGLGAFGCGLASFWFYPDKVADRTYLSENALLPTHADTQFGQEEARGIYTFNKAYSTFLAKLALKNLSPQEASQRTAVWLGKQLSSLGCKVYVQCYRPQLYPSETERRAANGDDVGYNVYAVLSSPRGDGTEALVLSSRYETDPGHQYLLTGPPVLLGLMKLFESRAWRDKEFVVVFTDGRHGDEGIKAWLNTYHSTEPFVSCLDSLNNNTSAKDADKLNQWTQFGFQRAGAIIGAINVDIRSTRPSELTLLAEGINGQLPNLDLINTAVRNARRSASLIQMPSDSARNLVAKLPSGLLQGVHISNDRMNLLNFLLSLAIGTGSGDHAAFGAHRIDCITLQARGDDKNPQQREDVTGVNALGRTLEGTVRSVNGLIERLHQSFYFYLLLDVDVYVPIGYYTPSLWLLLAPLIIKLLYLLYSFAAAKGPWAFDLARFTVIAAACIIIFYLPFVLQHVIDLHEHLLYAWFGLTALIVAIWLFVLLPALERALRPYLPTYALAGAPAEERRDWTAGAGIALCMTLLFLANCSVLNFSFCVIAAIVLSPAYALITPSASGFMNLLQLPVLMLFSPWGLLFLLSCVLEESFVATSLRVLSHFMEHSTLTYTFLFLPLLITNLIFLHLLLTSASRAPPSVLRQQARRPHSD